MAPRPLRERTRITSHDVADAIFHLIGPTPQLPEAYTKTDVVNKLIELAHMQDDSTIGEITPIMRYTMYEQFNNHVTNTAVFQNGYKRYENMSHYPVVPVTEFFFNMVHGKGLDCIDTLNDMTEPEVKNSLPRRRSRGIAQTDVLGNVVSYVQDDSGNELIFGQIAGIVVFPTHAKWGLLRAWLERLSNNMQGSVKSVVNRIENTSPNTAATARLKEHMQPVNTMLQRALPRPKK